MLLVMKVVVKVVLYTTLLRNFILWSVMTEEGKFVISFRVEALTDGGM